MTKQYFIELSEFNIWANNLVCNWLEHLNDDQWKQHIVSSFPCLYETVLHMAGTEKAWLERFKKVSHIVPLTSSFTGSKDDLVKIWKATSAELKTFIDSFNENELYTNLYFKRFNGDAYSTPYYQLFAHVINHATYHRGQLVTMLRQVGFTGTGSTDIVTFFDKKKEYNACA